MLLLPLLPLLPSLASASLFSASSRKAVRQQVLNASSVDSSGSCSLDQTVPPGDLTLCGNATLFNVFRPKARFIAPEGWMNDPMAVFQRDDGSIHIGYQYHDRHIQWGNISMGAAWSRDLTSFYDFDGVKTLWPSQIYDIRGVFDGSVFKGVDGLPTMLYTSTHTGPLGATVDEVPGVETQSITYTPDGGATWLKLPYGAQGNPVIPDWPEGLTNLTGFRDPFVFQSPLLSKLLANATSLSRASGDNFATVSGGVHGEGAKLFLYRQNSNDDVRGWTFLGPLLETPAKQSWSKFSGNFGTNFETAAVSRLNPAGLALDNGTDSSAVEFVIMGTEQGRDSHQAHWPLWAAVNYTARADGSIAAKILYSGVVDWGRMYAPVSMPMDGSRQILVGWTYEDDEDLVLATQQGYQGAFTLFRDMFIKQYRNVDPSAPGLFQQGSWGIKNETDGSVTVSTLGQRVVPETLAAFKTASTVSHPTSRTLNSTGFTSFAVQPTGRHYAISATFDFARNSTAAAGVRVLASDQEWTDVLYSAANETLTVVRTHSSLIPSYNNASEVAQLKLWPTVASDSRTLNLTVFVDNGVLEVYANEEATITTRVYPWMVNSTGAGLLSASSSSTRVSNIELWDGLVNAWPDRPANTSEGLVWDGPSASLYGLWTGI